MSANGLYEWLEQNYDDLLQEYYNNDYDREYASIGSWLTDHYPSVLKEWFEEGQ